MNYKEQLEDYLTEDYKLEHIVTNKEGDEVKITLYYKDILIQTKWISFTKHSLEGDYRENLLDSVYKDIITHLIYLGTQVIYTKNKE